METRTALTRRSKIGILDAKTNASAFKRLHTYSIDNVTGDLAFTSRFNFPVNSIVSPFALAVPSPPAQTSPRAYYVADTASRSVSVIDTGTNAVVATIRVGAHPIHLAIFPNGSRAYVANAHPHSVSIIDTPTNTVVAIPVGTNPVYVAAAPNGASVYIVNSGSGSVSVIDTTTNLVVATINVGSLQKESQLPQTAPRPTSRTKTRTPSR